MSQKKPRKKNDTALSVGTIFETTFQANRKAENPFRFRATHINGKRAPKVILCDDVRIRCGRLCRVRVEKILSPASEARGHIKVSYVGESLIAVDENFFLESTLAKTLQALLESGKNILLDGPQGSGKTVLSRLVAKALGWEYVFFNCSSVYEPTDFVATLQVRATPSGQAETVWIPTDIYRALETAQADPEKTFLVFLDEFNRCREMARNGIMPALDSTRKLYNPLTGSTLDIPDNLIWIAAINNGNQFSGTTTVDPAQLDRFAPLKTDYPPEEEEVKILVRRFPEVDEAKIRLVVGAANAVRRDEKLQTDLSMRATEEVCTLLAHPNFGGDAEALPALLKSSFAGRFVGRPDDPASDAGMVWAVIEGYWKQQLAVKAG